MNKTKSKVLSLILASAMIVSSFSSLNFASAATARTETGELKLADITYRNDDNEVYLVSTDSESAPFNIEDLIGDVSVETYDHETTSDLDFVKASHSSGDKLVSVDKDGNLTVRKNASGKEVITVSYEATYDRDDKEVTVKASKDITFYADKAYDTFVAEKFTAGASERPDTDFEAAVNEQTMTVSVAYAAPLSTTSSSVEAIVAQYNRVNMSSVTSTGTTKAYVVAGTTSTPINADLKNKKSFVKDAGDAKTGQSAPTINSAGDLVLSTDFERQVNGTTKIDKKAKLASVGSNTLQIKLGEVAADGQSFTKFDSSKTDVKVSVIKKWNADIDLTTGAEVTTLPSSYEINRKSGKTYMVVGSLDWDGKNVFSDKQDTLEPAVAVNTYDKIVTKASIKMLGGSVGNLDATNDITIEDGTAGDLKAKTISVEKATVGTIKVKGDSYTTQKITIDSGKVKAIDAKYAEVIINGGAISGDVVGNTVDIDAEDDDINTSIGGKVTAKASTPTVTIDASSDASVEVKGIIKGDVTVTGENVTLGTIDADYKYGVIFDDFTGTVKSVVNLDDEMQVNGDSNFALTGKLTAESIDIEEDAKLTVAEASIDSIDGDGTFAFPAGKLFVKDNVGDVKLIVTNDLAVGVTAFTSDEGAFDGSDLNTIGFTLETKSQNKTTDKHVIKSVQFAGVQFDKTALTIAKGHSDTVTVANYPSGTALPAGYSIEWNVDVNDDYITVTTEGNVATVKAVDFSTDRAVDNQGRITATVIDEDGNEVEDLLEASINITAIEKLPSVVTLDTTKPVTVGTNAVYQYIAKSSTAAVMTATSSDTQIATVELFNAADARGYKFQVKGVAEGTATITTTDANGASATLTVNVVKVNGTLKADTTTYTFAPGKVYDVKFSTTGTTAVPVVTVNGKVVSIAPRGNGVYRVTAQNAGTAYVVATVGNTHVSVKFVVAAGAASAGVTGNNVSILK